MTAKEYLNRAYRLDRKINRLIREKNQWKDMAYSISKDTTKPHYDPNRSTDAVFERCLAKADELERLITEGIDRLIDIKVEITETIMTLKDPTSQMLLMLRYIRFLSWEDISRQMGYSESWIFKKHGAALNDISRVLKTLQSNTVE